MVLKRRGNQYARPAVVSNSAYDHYRRLSLYTPFSRMDNSMPEITARESKKRRHRALKRERVARRRRLLRAVRTIEPGVTDDVLDELLDEHYIMLEQQAELELAEMHEFLRNEQEEYHREMEEAEMNEFLQREKELNEALNVIEAMHPRLTWRERERQRL